MDVIKFHCPECRQKIGVQSSDSNRQMDCPICHSTIIIPASADSPVQVVAARKSTQAVDPERKSKEFESTIRLAPQPAKPEGPSQGELDARAQLENAKAEILRLKSELEKRDARLSQVTGESTLLAERCAELVDRSAEFEAELQVAAEKIEALEKKAVKLKALYFEAAAFERANEELRAKLEGYDKQLATMTSLSDNQRLELRNAQSELLKVHSELDASRLQMQNVRRQLSEVGAHFSDSERERVQLQRQLQEIAPPRQ